MGTKNAQLRAHLAQLEDVAARTVNTMLGMPEPELESELEPEPELEPQPELEPEPEPEPEPESTAPELEESTPRNAEADAHKAVGQFLASIGEPDVELTEAVIAALAAADGRMGSANGASMWLSELQGLNDEGVLNGFLSSVRKTNDVTEPVPEPESEPDANGAALAAEGLKVLNSELMSAEQVTLAIRQETEQLILNHEAQAATVKELEADVARLEAELAISNSARVDDASGTQLEFELQEALDAAIAQKTQLEGKLAQLEAQLEAKADLEAYIAELEDQLQALQSVSAEPDTPPWVTAGLAAVESVKRHEQQQQQKSAGSMLSQAAAADPQFAFSEKFLTPQIWTLPDESPSYDAPSVPENTYVPPKDTPSEPEPKPEPVPAAKPTAAASASASREKAGSAASKAMSKEALTAPALKEPPPDVVNAKIFSAKMAKQKVRVTVDGLGLYIVEDTRKADKIGSHTLKDISEWKVTGKKNNALQVFFVEPAAEAGAGGGTGRDRDGNGDKKKGKAGGKKGKKRTIEPIQFDLKDAQAMSMALQGAKMARLAWFEMQKLSEDEKLATVEFLARAPLLRVLSLEERTKLAGRFCATKSSGFCLSDSSQQVHIIPRYSNGKHIE